MTTSKMFLVWNYLFSEELIPNRTLAILVKAMRARSDFATALAIIGCIVLVLSLW